MGAATSFSATFQSTLLVRGATQGELISFNPLEISIHAPRERSDVIGNTYDNPELLFQSTLLVRGATMTGIILTGLQAPFQSTLLVRGATRSGKVD